MVHVDLYLTLSAMLFTLGALGFIIRRNTIVVFMCIELMLNAVNLTLVAASRVHGNLHGQLAVFLVMVVAAAEAAVGLAVILALFRAAKSVESTDAAELLG